MIAPEWEAEFEAFVRKESPRLLGFALLLTGERGDAEDLLQIALLRVAKRWGVARESPELFTRRVAVNLACDRWRRWRRRPSETQFEDWMGGAVSGEEATRAGERELILRATRQLPVGQRAVLVLRFWEDLSVDETARVLGCGEGSVKSQTHRALRRLRELLEAQGVSTQSGMNARHDGSPVPLDSNKGGAPCRLMSE
ncbi:MAG: SigE family RNA polymerase sigma factor [Gaiellaceae bacterium]